MPTPIFQYLTPESKKRFWSHVAIGSPDECWLWTGVKPSSGYGNFGLAAGPGQRRLTVTASRVAWVIANGREIPLINNAGHHGTCVCHTCDTPLCCNPAHLWLGTNRENLQNRDRKGRQGRATARGEKSASAKLTESNVFDIRALYAAGGVTMDSLADRYSVSGNTIWQVVRRKSWRHC